jgi:N-dimethylarginine dimethylaminohydrolase
MKETNPIQYLFVYTPEIGGVLLANENPTEYLYKESIDVEKMIEQHSGLVSKILDLDKNIKIINLFQYTPKHVPMNYRTNLVFIRDTFVSLPEGVVLCNMKEDVRKEEIDVIEYLLQQAKIPVLGKIETGFLEGGDVLLYGPEYCFIGVNTRSTVSGALDFINKGLIPIKKLCIVYPLEKDRNMHRIHLDCIFHIIGDKKCVVWEKLLEKEDMDTRYIDEYRFSEKYNTWTMYRKGIHMKEYLEQEGFECISITTKSQENYGCNLLTIGDKILVQDEESFQKIENSVFIPFDEIHKMYGGIHCATNAIRYTI